MTKLQDSNETFKNLIDDITSVVFSESRSTIVNREQIRILCTLTMFPNDTFFWMKLDSKKLHIDNSNFSEIYIKVNREIDGYEINDKYLDDEEAKRIIFPPFKRV